jgi:hypothetical protein
MQGRESTIFFRGCQISIASCQTTVNWQLATDNWQLATERHGQKLRGRGGGRLVAAIEHMVSIAACRSAERTRRDLILTAHGLTGKQKPDGIQEHVEAIGPGVESRL